MTPTVTYFDDGSLLDFKATVLACEKTEDGYLVVLDATAFCPEGGGQRSDIGTLDVATVTDVWQRDGVIYHVIDRPLTVGAEVAGRVDRDRRLRHLQNHTGEHIVCGLMYSTYGFHNVGFHLGSEDVTMDLDGVVDDDMLVQIERRANEVVAANVPVRVVYPCEEQKKTMAYRAKQEAFDRVRVVVIDGVDACACCAPHVSHTGQVGMIKLLYAIHYKGGTRIHLKCGLDALAEFNEEYHRVQAISMAISRPHREVVAGVEKLKDDLAAAEYRLVGLRRQLIETKAESLSPTDGNVLFFEQDMDSGELRRLVTLAAPKVGGICAAFCPDGKGAYSFAAHYTGADFESVRAKLYLALRARGGGKAPMLQGKAETDETAIRAFFA